MNKEKLINFWVPFLLFILFAIIGLNNYKDYGIAWDENAQHLIGQKSYDYVTGKNQELLDFWDRDYGVAIELPLIFIEKIFNLQTNREIFLMRRLINHFLFLIAGIVFYFLIINLSKSWLVALISTLFLYLHPRIYAHSFFNTKDIPLLCLFIFCSFLLQKYHDKKNIFYALIVSIVAALTTNTRVVGILVPLSFSVYLLFLFIKSKYNYKYLIHFGVLIAIFPLVLVATWPYLWDSPVENFLMVFENMSKFRWVGHSLFFGEYIKSSEVPSYYLPVWILITTPLLFLVMSFFGIAAVFYNCLSHFKSFINSGYFINLLFQLSILVGPLFAIIILKSVVYDGWRQIYFIYPSALVFASYGIMKLFKAFPKWKQTIFFVLVIPNILHLYYYHPFQHTFFNEYCLTKSKGYLLNNFEMDYWGTSYQQAFIKLSKEYRGEKIKVCVEIKPGVDNYAFLDDRVKNKLTLVERSQADYFITNLRWFPKGYPEYKGQIFDLIETPSGKISITYRINK